MRKILRMCIVLIAILSISGTAQAQTLWGLTISGMSPKDVLKAVKDARLVKDGNVISGAIELVRVDEYRIANEPFKIYFYFSNNKLEQVTLNLEKKGSHDESNILFNTLATMLSAKYGMELSRNVGDFIATANWTNESTNINLICVNIEGKVGSFNVNYQNRFSKELDKL